ncbi:MULTISPECIES: 2-amino-4-hydroxy-6-hydroxymethyldihydropteridine diphosphokinase [unclassified Microbacterium]|uniref:2-amino-4-hydroxy-6- hydroxymethyldihydropteridine diphosphokinase n=1 Tax=unclassified Microbacterium TaxID=2609290 RepID=UPI00214C76AA|nr:MULTISPECIES: 2-amino-4-hydroxy-6-hydroxymethyldihydropteridine diphosphokinase [unclassified Microbacterium]MCR2784716.1 2-amino-4-hydroxy-6-hydroxymethyldihydropteridine diphosphokinase [Microbacterium sp. zg.B96]WIM16256.1 2-amino-4-hydroxy-6-hydroxymethyldihydropteridine diphosphokinase [Microbacterium sp. zg-B96]
MNRRLAQGISADTETPSVPPSVAVVALGANLGDRAATMTEAVQQLARMPLTTEIIASAPIETVALTADGPDPQAPAYLNAVALVHTRLAPSVLLEYLHAIEAHHGRPPRDRDAARWQSRTLDLDLITYGDVRSADPALLLPHPRAAERDFVLRPWLTVDPDAELPGYGRVAELLQRLRDTAAEEHS